MGGMRYGQRARGKNRGEGEGVGRGGGVRGLVKMFNVAWPTVCVHGSVDETMCVKDGLYCLDYDFYDITMTFYLHSKQRTMVCHLSLLGGVGYIYIYRHRHIGLYIYISILYIYI